MSGTIGAGFIINPEDWIMLEAGASAPDFTLKSHDGEEVSLTSLRGKWVVLHTFPLAFTGG